MMEKDEDSREGEGTPSASPPSHPTDVRTEGEEVSDRQCEDQSMEDKKYPSQPTEPHKATVKEDVNGDRTRDLRKSTSDLNAQSCEGWFVVQDPSGAEGLSPLKNPEEHTSTELEGDRDLAHEQVQSEGNCSQDEATNTEHQEDETGYDNLVKSVMNCLAEFRNPLNDLNDETPGQISRSNCDSNDDDSESEHSSSLSDIEIITSDDEYAGEPNIPWTNNLQEQNSQKHRTSDAASDARYSVERKYRSEESLVNLAAGTVSGTQRSNSVSDLVSFAQKAYDPVCATAVRVSSTSAHLSDVSPVESEEENHLGNPKISHVPTSPAQYIGITNPRAPSVRTGGFTQTYWSGGIAREYRLLQPDGCREHPKMHGLGRLFIDDKQQFLEGIWNKNILVELRFCQLLLPGTDITVFIVKRPKFYLLSMDDFVATISLNSLDTLDLTASPRRFKNEFLRKITVQEVLMDEYDRRRQSSLTNFVSVLRRLICEDGDAIAQATLLIFIAKCLKNPRFTVTDFLLYRNMPEDLRAAVNDLRSSEAAFVKTGRNIFDTPNRLTPLNMKQAVSNIYEGYLLKHRQTLASKCPDALPRLASEINKLDGRMLLYITKADIAVFEHIASLPCFDHYRRFFDDLVEKFCRAIRNIKSRTPSEVMPILPTVYGFLVKSFWEIILEIIEAENGYKPEDFLKYESGVWNTNTDIMLLKGKKDSKEDPGPLSLSKSSGEKCSLVLRSLVAQYNIVFLMMKKFSPENDESLRNLQFKFSFVLDHGLPLLHRGLKRIGKTVGLAKRLENLPPEQLVWLHLLDQSIHTVLKDEPKYQSLLEPYTSLLKRHISFVEKSTAENHELMRVMTHNIVKFITSTIPYFKDSQGQPGVDVSILIQQIWTFSNVGENMEYDHLAMSNSRDLMAEYNRYLSLRSHIQIEPMPGYFSSQLSKMTNKLMHIVANSMKKQVPPAVLVGYLRSLNDFLSDFITIDFLGMWFVKSMVHHQEVMEKIDNKLNGTKNCSYRVTDIENYVGEYQALGHRPPDHYIIKIVMELLKCLDECLNKNWESDQLPVAQLESTSILMDAVRRSLMYLKEQPDYVEFEAFKKESVGPFVRLLRDCSTIDSLTKRANIVKDSFWYLRKMDEIGIDQALAMFKQQNTSCPDLDKILVAYNLYIEHYEKYVAEYSCCISSGKSHSEALDAVKEKIDLQPESFHFSKWTEEFKTTKIPVLLAGLSAIWSILVSQDISNTGKFLKPHCIQIVCVMKLLGVDSKGVDKHLAQVLTGQGKSVVLALLSSTLALTGHKVRVLCYSEYLSSRDQNDAEDLFEHFQINEEITYGTFRDMAERFLNPVCNGVQMSLRDLVKQRVLERTDWSLQGTVTTVSKNTVLLIDEVDVFFSENFYGSQKRSCRRVNFSALLQLQENMWKMALENKPAEHIFQLSKELIAAEVAAKNPSMLELDHFINIPGYFNLLVKEGNQLNVKRYSNRSLVDEHLLEMAKIAVGVVHRHIDSVKFKYKLNSNGNISTRDPTDGTYKTIFCSYWVIFSYFKLKGTNFDSRNFSNYGYLKLDCGDISYARLPSQHDLILGVSGTASNLGKYEKIGLESAGIKKFSILPSFYGDSNLKFDEKKDFHVMPDEQSWLKEIYGRANLMVQAQRAVLIIFESYLSIALFSKEYKIKFDRMNEITPNTNEGDRDLFIEESGLSGAVTLATREMGRGVDYKSSLSVEKNGGVHVVQTFFSTDIKEEVQIKGRTARKDNRGSYEMIICREHLVTNNVIPRADNTHHSYASLDQIRKRLADESGQKIYKKIQECESDHITTMKYYGLM